MSATYAHNSRTVFTYFQEDHGVECGALYDMRNRDALVMTKRSVVMVK
jgi:hypothetical protein